MPREGHDLNAVARITIEPTISIHVPREGHDDGNKTSSTDLSKHFNPRAPRGARRAVALNGLAGQVISIHVPREGHDLRILLMICPSCHFNPRAPRGARRVVWCIFARLKIISIHVPREGHDLATTKAEYNPIISIHVPREGHDPRPPMHRIKGTDFNPRAPRGARPPPEKMFLSPHRFQSTCPARGTTFDQKSAALLDCISIHVPREGHDRRPVRFDIGNVISIHVPREGHDRKQTALFLLDIDFNPRAPRGARPPTFKDEFLYIAISIHVPREGHDRCPVKLHTSRE